MINLEDFNKPAAGAGQAAQRTQSWQTDSIREKLLLIQNLILSPLTQMGYGPSTGLWEKCIILNQPLASSVSALLEMADGKQEPLGGLNPNITFLFTQIREEMYTQAPHEGAWINCEFIINSKDVEEPVLLFEYDDPQKIPGLVSDREKLNAEFKQFPRSEAFTPLWWQTMLVQPVPYLSRTEEDTEEAETCPEEEEEQTTPAAPVIQRTQTWQTDTIREKLLLMQNYILAPLTQGGHGPASGVWKKCVIYGFPINQRGVVMLDMTNGKQEYLDLPGNVTTGLGMMFNQVREEMYTQAPYEGAWLSCEYIIDSQDVDSPSLILTYDDLEGFPGGMRDKKDVNKEFQKFPRGEYFTPEWWQEMLDETVEYLPVPEGVLPDPNAGILEYIEQVRENLQHDPKGVLHLPERLQLYQQIGDPVTVNKIFLECAKKVFPLWKERFPEDKKLLQLLRTIHNYLYEEVAEDNQNTTGYPVDEKVLNAVYKELVKICKPNYEWKELPEDLLVGEDKKVVFYTNKNYTAHKERNPFVYLDIKMDVEDVKFNIETVLKENFNVSPVIPDLEQYEGEALVEVFDEVFTAYKSVLNAIGYDLLLTDTSSDSYSMLVYPLAQQHQVREILVQLGESVIWEGDESDEEEEDINFYELYEKTENYINSLSFKSKDGTAAHFVAGLTLAAVAFNIYADGGSVLDPERCEEYEGLDDGDLDGDMLSPDYIAFLTDTNYGKDTEQNRIYWSWFLDTVSNLVNDAEFATSTGAVTKKKKGSTEEILSYIEELKQKVQDDSSHWLHLPERMALYQHIGEPLLISKIFFECAKKAYPFWQQEFPADRYIPELLHKMNNYLYKGLTVDENGEEYNFFRLCEDYKAFVESINSRATLAGGTILYTAFYLHVNSACILEDEYDGQGDEDRDSEEWLPDYYGAITEVSEVEETAEAELAYWPWFLETVACLVKDPEHPILQLPSVPPVEEDMPEELKRTQVLTTGMEKKLLTVWDQLAGYDLSEYDGVTVLFQTMPWVEVTVYLLEDGEVVESDYGEGQYIKDESVFLNIRKEMYEQAPHEGAWLNCTCTFSLKRRIITDIFFNYGEKETEQYEDLKEQKEFEYLKKQSADLVKEFQEYPRSREYTPRWWQRWIAISDYLPLPEVLQEIPHTQTRVKSTEEIFAYIEELRNIIREYPSGKLPLSYRMELYQQIGDPVKINRIFYECAKKVYPIWQKSYPKDRILPSLLFRIQEFLYPDTEEERDIRWFLQNGNWSYTGGETGITRDAGYATTNLVTNIIMEAEDVLKKEDYTGADDNTFDPILWLPDYCAYAAIEENPEKNRQYWNWLLDTVQAVLRNPGIRLSDTPQLPPAEPEQEPFQRKQGIFIDSRSKLFIIREAIIADLGLNNMKGWHEALLIIDTIEQIKMRLTLIKYNTSNKNQPITETPPLYAKTFPNLFGCIEKGLITELKELMYKEAPHEGAWCQCAVTCILFERNVGGKFNYDEKEFYGRVIAPASIRKEFAKYPRNQEFTPNWWQACLNVNTNYIELPLKIKREKMDEIRRAYVAKEDQATILGMYQAIQDKNVTQENGDTLLHIAAEAADHQAIAYLLWAGIDPDVQNQMGETALHKLARLSPSSRGNIGPAEITRCIEILLNASASPLVRNERDDTCYHTAAGVENLTFIKVLVNKGAKLDIIDKEGRNLLHLIPAEIMRREIDRLRYTKKEEDIEKIHKTVEDAYQVCKLLLQYGLDPEKKDSRNKSPFELAVEYNLKKLAVLYSGEDPDSPEGRLKAAAGGKTIHQAAATGDVEAIEALIDLGSDPNEVYLEYEFKHMTPLAIAAIKGFKSCVEALLRKGADLHFRSGESGEGVMKFVIDKLQDRTVYAPNKWIMATEMMQVFLDHGLDVNIFVDNESHTLLNYTCLKRHWNTRGRQQIGTLLLDTKRCDMNIPDINGRTPLMNYVQSEFHKNPEIDLIAMLEQGASLTARDKDGNNAVMCAAANKNHLHAYNITNMILDFGYPPLDEVNNQGQTALDIAVEKGHEDLVKLLLSKI